ncbi:MAG TPA: FUSC family protein [Polyangiaceae bacterium]|nr:FUSC family protein [Polyangiaceae bacterium]
MFRWFRRQPAHVVNGVTVSLGVAFVQLTVSSVANASVAQAASAGAVLASLPHLTGRALPTLRRTLAGGTFAALASFAILALATHPIARGIAVALIAFFSLLLLSWGPKAGPIAFSAVIAVVFSLARPGPEPALPIAAATALGVVLYALWAFCSAKLLEPHYRVLSVASAVEAAAALLRARATVLFEAHEAENDGSAARFGQVHEEARLAEALQNASDLVFPAAEAAKPLAAILSRLAELRELVLTSRLDLELLGDDSAGRFVRARLALALKKLSGALDRLALTLRDGSEAELGGEPLISDLPDLMEAASLLEGDARAPLLPVVATRLGYLVEEVEAIRALSQGSPARASQSPEQLSELVADDDSWPLALLTAQFTLSSPVLRHALRSALALSTVYFLAYALPWTTRPYWMLLSVAVVLRGTLDNTLSRRNQRVLGTAIGCVAVACLVPIASDTWLRLSFFAAVGTAHAFVNVRYLLTAASGTVMALLQARLAAPTNTVAVVERLLDTVIGALLAWAFSYVLPSWERRTLPTAIRRALDALRDYSDLVLGDSEGRLPAPRVLRQRAYDALEVVAAALRRSAAEPKRVQPPVRELVSALDHGQRLMAHLSSVRTLLFRRGARLPADQASAALARTRRDIHEQLVDREPSQPFAPLPLDFELPRAPAAIQPLPWLIRRLEASSRDAAAAGASARAALRDLSKATPRAFPR